MAYDYPDKELWDVPRTWNIGTEPLALRPRIRDMPREGRVDFDRLIDSEYGERMIRNFKPYILFPDEMDPGLLAYYEETGLRKEQFETDDLYTKWSLYTPLSIYSEENKDRRYPFLFVNHGAAMPIYWEEHSGFLPIAAREEMIVVAAQNHNADNLLRILDIVKGRFHVDESRIYCTGYSQGGMQTNNITLAYPELFAAAAPCGIHLFEMNDKITPGQIENVRIYDLPVVIVAGQEESLEVFPANQDNIPAGTMGPDRHSMSVLADPTLQDMIGPDGRMMIVMPTTAEGKIALLNKRLYSMRHRELTLEECLACAHSDNEVERNLGFPADRTEIFELAGVRHFAAYFTNDKGQELLKIVSAEGQPHWPQATMAEIVWEFMKKFSRNPQTKELVIHE